MERMQAKARARFAFSEYLGRSGKRCTPERLRILDIVMEQRKPFTAEDVLAEASGGNGIAICRATLYNTLPLIVDAGFMRRLAFDKTVYYECIRSGQVAKPRVVMVCSECGKVHKSYAPSPETWLNDVAMRGFSPRLETTMVYIEGTCSRCRRSLNLKYKSLNSTNK